MTQQGWSEGQALGARDVSAASSSHSRHRSGLATDAERLAAARVGILFKDDNLGLGAARRAGGADVEAQKTGFDAFQGLLGRLNGKGDVEQREEGKKVEERKLEMFFRGRWGGMVFVRGGVLVGNQDQKEDKAEESEEPREDESEDDDKNNRGDKQQRNALGALETGALSQDQTGRERQQERDERRRIKTAKKERKEEKRRRKEEKAQRKARREGGGESASPAQTRTALPLQRSPISISHPPDEPVSSAPSSDDEAGMATKEQQKNKKKRKVKPEQVKGVLESEISRPSSPSVLALKNGRHLLRGRNIQAKKMVLADAKGLDQIFMR
jgi:Pin2-interacting protein X1